MSKTSEISGKYSYWYTTKMFFGGNVFLKKLKKILQIFHELKKTTKFLFGKLKNFSVKNLFLSKTKCTLNCLLSKIVFFWFCLTYCKLWVHRKCKAPSPNFCICVKFGNVWILYPPPPVNFLYVSRYLQKDVL